MFDGTNPTETATHAGVLLPFLSQVLRDAHDPKLRLLAVATLASVGVTALSLHFGKPPQSTASAVSDAPGEPIPKRVEATKPALPFTVAEPVGEEGEQLFSDIGGLTKGSTVLLPLSGGGRIEGRLNYVKTHPNAATVAGGELSDGSGTFEIAREPWGFRGFVLQKKERIAYVYSGDANGLLQVARRPIGEVICEPDPNWKPLVNVSPPVPDEAAIYNGGRSVGIISEAIPILHSLPRAAAVIYLDFDGEVIEGQSWDGGRRIIASAYNLPASEVTDMCPIMGAPYGATVAQWSRGDGTGNATWATNGYDDYGSLGAYTITGTIPTPRWTFQVPVNALNGAVLGSVAPGSGSGFSITAGNTGTAFAINAYTGVLSVVNAGALASNSSFNLTVAYTAGVHLRQASSP